MRESSSFDPPMESEWHRMISEAAYFSQKSEASSLAGRWMIGSGGVEVKEVLSGRQNELAP